MLARIPEPLQITDRIPARLAVRDQGIYKAILEHEGIEVAEAEDGEVGVRVVRERLPDLILKELSVPVLDGLQATRILKADVATASISIIALTTHALPADRQRAEEAGYDAYIAKPALPRSVLDEVRRWIEKGRG